MKTNESATIKNRRYTIVSGFWSEHSWVGSPQWTGHTQDEWIKAGADYKTKFFEYWWQNTISTSQPIEVVTINSASPHMPAQKHGTWIDLKTNLGHVHDLDREARPLQFGGWSMSFLMGALHAYNNLSDLIVKGQNCLAFGNWIDRMYQELDEKNLQMLTGSTNSNHYGIEQSLIIIRHAFIIPFLTYYMSIAEAEGGMDKKIQPENKFLIVMKSDIGRHIGFLPFGYGKMRPVDFSEPAFYMQRVGPTELNSLIERGLVPGPKYEKATSFEL